MANVNDFPNGTRVSFKPGPRSKVLVRGEVTGRTEGTSGRGGSPFVVTMGDDGIERKVRAGALMKI